MRTNYTRHIVPCEYKYPHELKYLALLTNFNRSTDTYAPEFTVYTSKSYTGIQYYECTGCLLSTTLMKDSTWHCCIQYQFTSCTALEEIQRTVPAEITDHCNFITSDYIPCCSQSSSLVAVFTDGIIVQVFDANSSLWSLVNEFEKENWFACCVENLTFQNVISIMHVD